MAVSVSRIVLVLEGEHVPAWQFAMLEHLLAMDSVALVAVLFRPTLPSPLAQRIGIWCLRALQWVDGKLFRAPPTARQAVSILGLLGDVSLCDVGSKRYQALLDGDPVDVVLDLTGQTVLPALLPWARYGVWRHVFGMPARWSDQYAGVREYATRQDETTSALVRVTVLGDASECLYYATSSTDPGSLNRGMERALWKMADVVPQRLRALQHMGEAAFRVNAPHCPPLVVDETPFPLWQALLQLLVRYPLNFARKLYWRLFFAEQWVLLLGRHEGKRDTVELGCFRKLMPPPDRFWADPFVVSHEGSQYVFFEELLYQRGLGHLSCLRLGDDGSPSEAVKILEKPYHLSYPFVFLYQGQYYMIPETAGNHTVELYRCEAFPHRWVFEKNLMEGVEAYDATLLEHDGRWWMFVGMRNHANCSSSEALYLFHADSPLSSHWQPHPQNPVVALASRARPAGRIFASGGRLYRPSQHCAGSYGRGLNINLIQQLDRRCYREERVSCCLPEGQGNLVGIHTLGFDGELVVADAIHLRRRFVMPNLGWR